MTPRALTLSASLLLTGAIGLACTAKSTTDTGSDSDSSLPDSGGGDLGGDDLGGDGLGTDSGSDTGGDADCGDTIEATIRDFKGFGETGGHTDFEISAKGLVNSPEDPTPYKGWNDVGCGLVLPDLGADGLPVFNGVPVTINNEPWTGIGAQRRVVSGPGCFPLTGECNVGTCTAWTNFTPPAPIIQTAASFSDWYTTKEGINKEVKVTLALPETPPGSGIRLYDSNAFFPLDDKVAESFGPTPGQAHNYHFTTEIHVTFVHEAGKTFSFRGDDDLWIFVNKKLALDVGGAHQALGGTINFDTLGLTAGAEYAMDIYHAERQTTESNFRIETTISCLQPVVR